MKERKKKMRMQTRINDCVTRMLYGCDTACKTRSIGERVSDEPRPLKSPRNYTEGYSHRGRVFILPSYEEDRRRVRESARYIELSEAPSGFHFPLAQRSSGRARRERQQQHRDRGESGREVNKWRGGDIFEPVRMRGFFCRRGATD